MALNSKDLTKVPRKLRKSVRNLRRDASVEQVHQIRTRSRRLEALLHALQRDSHKNERALLKAMKPVRRKAGTVRDADVLIGFASRIHLDGKEENCSLRLLEHLGAERWKGCRKLKKVADTHASEITRRARKLQRFLGRAQRDHDHDLQRLSDDAAIAAFQQARQLQQWPGLSRRNLHPFRLAVKELRNMLRAAEHQDAQLIDDLGTVKDEIGEWHDWDQLAAIAKKVIQHPGCELLKTIQSKARKKLESALALSNGMRKRDLTAAARWAGRSNSVTPKNSGETLTRSAVVSMSSLAA